MSSFLSELKGQTQYIHIINKWLIVYNFMNGFNNLISAKPSLKKSAKPS